MTLDSFLNTAKAKVNHSQLMMGGGGPQGAGGAAAGEVDLAFLDS